MSTALKPRGEHIPGVDVVRIALAIVVGLVLLIGGWYLFSSNRARPGSHGKPQTALGTSGDASAAADPGQAVVAALGRLEPSGGVRQIGAQPGDRLGQVLVRVGEKVTAGAELAYLDSRSLIEAERDLAQSQLNDARQKLDAEKIVSATTVATAELGLDETKLQQRDIANQEARVGLAQANLELIQKEIARLDGLSAELVPPQELDQKRLLERQAREELNVAKTMLDKLKAGTSLAQRAAQGKLDAARANAKLLEAGGGIGSLEQTLRLAQARLDRTIVRAPLAGEILDILTQPGEMISQRPILQMADLSQMQVVAEVYETDIGQVRLGQRAVATSRALGEPLQGSVVEIGALVSQNEVQSLTASTPTAQRVIKVRIQLDESAKASRLINLQVDVQFLGGQQAASIANSKP